jgi:hypothetical protein
MKLSLMRLAAPLAVLAAVPAAAVPLEEEPRDAAVLSAPTPAGLEMPKLDFTQTPEMASDFEKYFYFHRADTSFAEAYADIRECDALASGISYYAGDSEPYSGYYAGQYGIGGVIGGAIGNMLADAIFGSAERRRIRRGNLRNCMGYKDYKRYGLSRDLWKAFNFEEGNGRKNEQVRERAIRLQALVASGPTPQTGVLPK